MSVNSKQSNDKKASRLENFFKSSPQTQGTNKRDNSGLSPIDNSQSTKRMNMEEDAAMNGITMESIPGEEKEDASSTPDTSLKQIIGPLIEEVKALRESFHQDHHNLERKLESAIEAQKGEFDKLEASIATEKNEMTSSLTSKIEIDATNINQLLEENRILRKENISLRECMTKIEVSQMANNIILSGMPKEPWESYESTKGRVIKAIAASMGSKDDSTLKEEAKKVEITCCSRVGYYRMGKPRPISVTFQNRDDKEKLMSAKRNLPPGIYVNHKYPMHIKKA